jgi:hypothetical protein
MLAEVTRQEAPATGAGGDIDAPAIRSNPSCLDALTLRSARAMLNCTEVIGRHRNGCTGYTKVCEPARGDALHDCAAVTLCGRSIMPIYPVFPGAPDGDPKERPYGPPGKQNSFDGKQEDHRTV